MELNETVELMNRVISDSYETIKLKTAKVVYGELLVKCEEYNFYPPSYTTFCESFAL